MFTTLIGIGSLIVLCATAVYLARRIINESV